MAMGTDRPFSVVVGIGHDGSPDPALWALGVRGILEAHGTLDAYVDGLAWSSGWGDEPASWYSTTFDSVQSWHLARASILHLAAEHSQDAVAFTVGTTETPSAVRATEVA